MSLTKLQEYNLSKSNPNMALFQAIQDMKRMASEFVSEAVEREKKIIQKEMESELKEAIASFKSSIKEIEAKAIDKLENLAEDFSGKHGTIVQLITEKIQNETAESLLRRIPELKGEKGERGEKGEKGSAGMPGQRGRQGLPGLRGVAGERGKDGSPDTSQQIADKLNTLTEKVEMSVIKGLQKEFSTMRQNIRQGKTGSGGGMGNVQHEAKNVNLNTTSVSVNYPIAGNGYAIWAYYQGQLIARGVGYTVGIDFRTLSLLFIPANGTVIDLIYIRG